MKTIKFGNLELSEYEVELILVALDRLSLGDDGKKLIGDLIIKLNREKSKLDR